MGVVIRRWVWLESIGVVSGCFPHKTYISLLHLYLLFFAAVSLYIYISVKKEGCLSYRIIVESVDSVSRDERDAPLTQYITNAGITRARYTITLFKHHHRVPQLISNRMSV